MFSQTPILKKQFSDFKILDTFGVDKKIGMTIWIGEKISVDYRKILS